MSQRLERAAGVVQAVSPRYRSLIGDQRWSNPFFVLGNSGNKATEGGDCLATALIGYSQYPSARIIRETLKTEEFGIDTHYYLATLIGKVGTLVADRYASTVGVRSTARHFGYWAGFLSRESLRETFVAKGPQLLASLVTSGGEARVIQERLTGAEHQDILRLALVDPVLTLRAACGDTSATFEELAFEINTTLENGRIEV